MGNRARKPKLYVSAGSRLGLAQPGLCNDVMMYSATVSASMVAQTVKTLVQEAWL